MLTQSFTLVFGEENLVIYSNGSITVLSIVKVRTVPFRIFLQKKNNSKYQYCTLNNCSYKLFTEKVLFFLIPH